MAQAPKRIYVVAGNLRVVAGSDLLVRAQNRAQALRHVMRAVKIEVASQDKLIALVQGGAQVEDAGDVEEAGDADE